MKKLLALILVLALCGIATSATLDIYITDALGSSEITIAPSDYIELVLWSVTVPAGHLTWFDVEATAEGPGTILGGAITATTDVGTRNTIYDITDMPGYMGGDIELSAATDMGQLFLEGLAHPLATIEFHCDAPGDVTISLSNDGAAVDRIDIVPTLHGMIIHQIPEPATIVLLCLGGLLLRKK